MARPAPYIGQMNCRIDVIKPGALTRTGIGEPKQDDVLVCQPWAQRSDVSGSQEVEGSIINTVRRSYTIYRNPEVAENGRHMFIKDGVRRFRVTAMKEIGNTHLELIVENHE